MNKPLYKSVDDILWNDWDPVHINDLAPRNEYQAYVPIVYEILAKGASREQIADKLTEIEKDELGLEPDLIKALEVADKLINARDSV